MGKLEEFVGASQVISFQVQLALGARFGCPDERSLHSNDLPLFIAIWISLPSVETRKFFPISRFPPMTSVSADDVWRSTAKSRSLSPAETTEGRRYGGALRERLPQEGALSERKVEANDPHDFAASSAEAVFPGLHRASVSRAFQVGRST